MNIAEIESSLKDLVEKPFDPASFAFDFMAVYDAPKATITKLRQAAEKKPAAHHEIHWKRKLLFRAAPEGQASAMLAEMAAVAERAKKDAPRILMATDGRELVARDLKFDAPLDIDYAVANDAFDFFLPLANVERYQGVAESPADIKATGRVAKLYDAILEANPDWREAAKAHSLNLFMTRLLFCLFAEDTSIFEQGLFTRTALSVSREDGTDFADTLTKIFEALASPPGKRDTLPEFARRFPYVNGGLFSQSALIPIFTRRARRLVRECGELRWSSINPDIFGSMIQAVVEPEMRGDMGMHYTSVPNIMKALQPLFLLSLEGEFDQGRDSEAKLMRLLKRIYNIRVFDPACGSGNFLIIAYRELRKLESRVFERLAELGKGAIPMTGVHLSQFYGIELADFATETAKLSLWITEYQMNERFKEQFGTAPPALPLRDSGNIVHGNALRKDWTDICPMQEGLEIYLVGNPPYLGRAKQTAQQKEDMALTFSHRKVKFKNLDYVSCWTIKGAEYCMAANAKCAFVTTNSICQGEQVNLLWPQIYAMGVEIDFAHQAFKWRNNAAKNAGVTCVIVGLRRRQKAPKTLYVDGMAIAVKNINAYLIDFDDVVVRKRSTPISNLPSMDFGSMANDDGGLILSPTQRLELLRSHPESEPLVRRLYGSQEFIKGIERWCLWIPDDQAEDAARIPEIARRIQVVRRHRSESTRTETVALADCPHRFGETRWRDEEVLIVPSVSSERRPYLPVGVLPPGGVVSNLAFTVYSPPAHVAALLASRLHLTWAAAVGGQLETRLRYSNTLVYNTFPVPDLSKAQEQELEERLTDVISAREAFPGKTIAWLYDPDFMPESLREAHARLDAAIERIYVGRLFRNDAERLEHLFKRYVTLLRNQALELDAEPKRRVASR